MRHWGPLVIRYEDASLLMGGMPGCKWGHLSLANQEEPLTCSVVSYCPLVVLTLYEERNCDINLRHARPSVSRYDLVGWVSPTFFPLFYLFFFISELFCNWCFVVCYFQQSHNASMLSLSHTQGLFFFSDVLFGHHNKLWQNESYRRHDY